MANARRPTYPTSPKAEPPRARGDAITGDRYWSREFAQLEWDKMWTRVWHIAGRATQMPEPGDFVVHNFLHESVIVIRQAGGGFRAFYNVCRHRGNRLALLPEGGVTDTITCSYHGWAWGIDGVLRDAQDPEDFPQGNPCGKLKLKELPCDTWGGFVFYSFDPAALPLLEFLDPVPELLSGRKLEDWVRIIDLTISIDTNWKFASDNFNESYHLPTVHPQQKAFIDEDYRTHVFEMYPSGHNRVIEMGRPSLRSSVPNEVEGAWAALLAEWGLDPADFKGRARAGRLALQKIKREQGRARGFAHYETLYDDELTDYFHHTMFPNLTITAASDGLHVFRTEPVCGHPGKCTFDYWYLSPRVAGRDQVETIYGMRPLAEAQKEIRTLRDHVALHGTEDFLTQDMQVGETQQLGLQSAGYDDAYLSGQETRVRRFHEVLNDYIEGRR